MKLYFEIKADDEFMLRLEDQAKGKILQTWKGKSSLSRFFLKKIDEILRKKKAGVDNISEYKIISHVPENWTNYRIAKVTLESLMIAKLAK